MEKSGKLVDLSHTLENDISVFPGMQQPCIKGMKSVSDNGLYYMISDIHINSHHGTHMDAPCHFVDHTLSVDQLPLEQCCGIAKVISLVDRSMEDVEKEIRELTGIEILLFKTGMGKHWNTPVYQQPFPMISAQVARLIVERKFKGIGVDCLSIDLIDSKDFEVHRIILGANLYAIENLADLSELESKEFEFMCFPLKIGGCDGSPVRAVARLL